ncbi:BppU family phage baseplate upper protein [Arenicella sp.]|nr:BppU family phage baseplate upper protein [Arenicella sp.]
MAFYIKQNDTSPSILATLKDANDTPVNLTAADVRIHIKDLVGSIKVDAEMQVINAPSGIARYDWLPADTDTSGTYSVEFEVTYTDGSIETFPNTGSLALVITKELN